MKRVLVTGGSGFIGRQSHEPLLRRGYEVHCVSSRRTPKEDNGAVTWHTTDLLDPADLRTLVARVNPTHLLHFAWYAAPGLYWTSTENVRWLEASLRLLRTFAGQGGRRAVYVGTCAEYDWSFGLCSETSTPNRPSTLYGATKHALQVAATPAAKELEVSLAGGRLFFVYGPFEPPSRLVPAIVRPLLSASEAACSEGRQIRDFLHTEDAADAFVALLESTVEGPVNIGSGDPARVRDIAAMAGDILHRRGLIRYGAVPQRPGEPPVILADTRRLRDEVGWTPRFSLESGLRDVIEWWRRDDERQATTSAERVHQSADPA